MNINHNFDNKSYSEKLIRPKNICFPLINNPVINVDNTKIYSSIQQQQKRINKVLTSSGSIVPAQMLPNIFVQPLVQKWSPIELKVF